MSIMSSQPHETDLTGILDDLRRIISSLWNSSRSAERAFGLTVAQYFVLKTLAEAPALSISELARRTCAHPNTVSVVLPVLLRSQLVARTESNLDPGRTELAVTPQGRALLAKAPMAAQERLIECIEQLPAEERSALASALRHIATGMLLDDERPMLFFEEEEPVAGRQTTTV
jgi:MarR family transcriptional regulator, lower aerobic nicotinate degradation pathway regulator